jgi:outer membrane beta-barrel protein
MPLPAPAIALLLSALAALVLPQAALAQAAEPADKSTERPTEQKPANEQVIVPQVDRREVKLPKFPSNDIELGLFTGTYATQNFGTSSVRGVRLGYHVTEDVFVEATFGRTTVSDEAVRSVLAAGILASPNEKLTYYNVSAGYNLLPGEVFIGKNNAKASAVYLIGGIGSTNFAQRRRQTFNFGLGVRVFLADWAAVQVDMRDHIFTLDLLGKSERTQNLELTAGLTFFF